MFKKKKKVKITLGDIFDAVNVGFNANEKRFNESDKRFASIEANMVTKVEFEEYKEETRKRFNKVDMAIEDVKSDLAVTEDLSVTDLQHRMLTVERDIRQIKQRS